MFKRTNNQFPSSSSCILFRMRGTQKSPFLFHEFTAIPLGIGWRNEREAYTFFFPSPLTGNSPRAKKFRVPLGSCILFRTGGTPKSPFLFHEFTAIPLGIGWRNEREVNLELLEVGGGEGLRISLRNEPLRQSERGFFFTGQCFSYVNNRRTRIYGAAFSFAVFHQS
jgi:hypothetical protein